MHCDLSVYAIQLLSHRQLTCSCACRKRLHTDVGHKHHIASEGFEADGFVKDGRSKKSSSRGSSSGDDFSSSSDGDGSRTNSVEDRGATNGQVTDDHSNDSRDRHGVHRHSDPQLDRFVLLLDQTCCNSIPASTA